MKLVILILAVLLAAGTDADDADDAESVVATSINETLYLIKLENAAYQAGLIPVSDIPVKFFLINKLQQNREEIFTGNTTSLTGSNFNASRPTRFVVHGWRGNSTSSMATTVASAYLDRGDFNVITVDWSSGADFIDYVRSRYYAPEAGMKLAAFINFLNDQGTSFDSIYLIGHSLGAHVCGIAGKNTREKVNTIFGLDAALVFFDMNDTSSRLTTDDASYVETIHTNGNQLGIGDPIGHSSFYPNWGFYQRGCVVPYKVPSCSHHRSYEYFAESLRVDNQFVGRMCESYTEIEVESCSGNITALMGGEPSNHTIQGIYYVPVNAQSPYATGTV